MTSPNIQGNIYKGEHQITKATFNLGQLDIKFINNFVGNMHSKFPNTSLLSAFDVLSLHPICFMNEEELKAYGDAELKILNGHDQTPKWRGSPDD